MAYLFNSVDDAEESGKANIFGGQQTGQQTTTGQTGDAVEKPGSDAPASTQGGGSGSSRPSSQPNPAASYNPKMASSAFNQAAQRVSQPKAVGEAQGALGSAQTKLQEKANAYQQGAQTQAQSYKVSDQDISSAAGGNKEAYTSLASRLQKSGPDQYAAFGGLGDEIPSVANVQDTSNLYRRESGPGYTGGMGRFDAALLRRNPEFQAAQSQIAEGAKNLAKQDSDAQTAETTKARTLLGDAFGKETESAKSRLGGLANEVTSAAQLKSKAENERRAGLDAKAISQADQAKIKGQIKQDLSSADPRSAQARSLGYLNQDFDISPYVNIDRDTDWREFLTQPDTERYNRIEGLLGNADLLTPGKGPGDAYSIDTQSARNSILDQLKAKRSSQDMADQDEIAKIQARAQTTADSYNKGDSGQNARDQALNQLIAYARSQYGSSPELAQNAEQHARSMFDPNSAADPARDALIHENTGADWRSVLSAPDVSRLNELNQDLGGMETYTAGNYRPEIDRKALIDLYNQRYKNDLDRLRDVRAQPSGNIPSTGQKTLFHNAR